MTPASFFLNQVGRLTGGLALTLTLINATCVFAAPPPGHPSAAKSIDMLLPGKKASKDLTLEGQVVSSRDANEFTYIEVKGSSAVEWIAVPLMTVKPGSTVRYEEGIVVPEFYSKLLKITFNNLRFVGDIVVTLAR